SSRFCLQKPCCQPAAGRPGGTTRQHDRVHAARSGRRAPRCGADRARWHPHRTPPGRTDLSAAAVRTTGDGRMTYEIDLFGVLVPSLVLWSVSAYLLARIISKLIARVGLYRWIWHPALFDFS